MERAQKLKVRPGTDPESDIGPVVSKKALARIHSLIQSGVDQGANLVMDGRGVKVRRMRVVACCAIYCLALLAIPRCELQLWLR